MPRSFTKPWYGIAIPCAIISFLGYGSQILIFKKFPLTRKQHNIFQIELVFIWLSYFIAIKMESGVLKFKIKQNENENYKIWKTYCVKCKIYKPERAHHCKTCNKCIVAFDHHCPWTMNCVGLNNFASFMRFLISVMIATSTLLYFLITKWYLLYLLKDNIKDSIKYVDVLVLFVFTAIDFLVLFTISALFLRCFKNQFVRGMTQIETWEMDRIESLALNNKLVPILLNNVSKVFDISFDKDNEWKNVAIDFINRSKKLFSYSYINFPYDLGFFSNCQTFMGPFYTWILPWGCSNVQNVYGFPKNDVAFIDKEEVISKNESALIDLILSLPWPPDGTRNRKLAQESQEYAVIFKEKLIEKVNGQNPPVRFVDPRLILKRNEWYNENGENLAYFGVDESFDHSTDSE
ncbi:hypothetical protein QEN19_000290 [Hanseniaspora menglaensis]